MIASLKRALDRGTHATEFCECRHCGTTVERPTVGCPTCDSEDIACYRF